MATSAVTLPGPGGAPLAGAGEALRTSSLPPPADAAARALDRFRRAQAELDRVTHQTDWRRSCYSPSHVLAPLVAAVARARADCQTFGLTLE
jgi:hypothetical protein